MVLLIRLIGQSGSYFHIIAPFRLNTAVPFGILPPSKGEESNVGDDIGSLESNHCENTILISRSLPVDECLGYTDVAHAVYRQLCRLIIYSI